jgi:glycosyltransferase involved in cell wall biosynthesis
VQGEEALIKLGVIALSKPNLGGTYQYTLSTLEALRHLREFEVTIYADPSNRDLAQLGYPVRQFVEPRSSQLLYLAAHKAGARLRDPFAEEDVLFAPIYSLATLHTAKPFAYTLHDIQEYHYPEYFSWQQRVWRHQVHSALSRRAVRIVCEASHVKEDIVRIFKVPRDGVDVIVAPPLATLRAPLALADLEEVRTRLKLPERFVFFPAQFWRHKNHLRLIEAFRLVVSSEPDLRLVLTGNRGEEYEPVMSRIASTGLTPNITHLGYVEQKDLQAIYQLALALVMPSLYESVSIPIFEAFQLGTPVVAANVLSLPDQVGDAGLLFDPLSSDAMARSILQVAGSAELAQSLRNRGLKRIHEMTPALYGRQLEALFRKLLDQHK